MATAKFSVEDAGDRRKAAYQMRNALRTFRAGTYKAMGQIGQVGEEVYKDHAPKDTGNLAGSISADGFSKTVRVRAFAYSPEGYNYLAVSRFGHRKTKIVPIEAKALNTKYLGFRSSVKGFKPAFDWAAVASQEVGEIAEDLMVDLLEDTVNKADSR